MGIQNLNDTIEMTACKAGMFFWNTVINYSTFLI